MILCLMVGASWSHAQTFTVKGVVRDASTNEPLGFAHVVADSSAQWTTTDEHGQFTFDVVPGDHLLRCSYVGYKSGILKLAVNADLSVTIVMQSTDVLLQDVTVYAHKAENESPQVEVSALSLQSGTIAQMTSAMPDVLRSIQMLPGVSGDNEMSAKFNVRGGNSDENLVLVNGTQVYEPYHVKEASNVSIGIFDVDLIKKMDLISGGFTARYGDRMSSVVNIEYRDGDREEYHGKATLSLTDFDALVEGPLSSKGSFIIGARQSYLQYVLKMFDIATTIHPSFYDVQGVLSYSIAPQNSVALKFIHAGDHFIQDPNGDLSTASWSSYKSPDGLRGPLTQLWHDSTDQHAHYYSTMVALQSTNILSSSALVRSEFSMYDQRQAVAGINTYDYASMFTPGSAYKFYRSTTAHINNDEYSILTMEFNTSLDLAVSPDYTIKTGGSYQRLFYDRESVRGWTVGVTENYTHYPDTTRTLSNVKDITNYLDTVHTGTHKVSGYLENIILLGEQVVVNVGGRFDYFALSRDLTWSPRLNIAYKAFPALTLRAAWGEYYQSPIPQQLASSTPSDTNTHSQRAIHTVLGAELDLPLKNQALIKIKLEGYHKEYSNLISSTVSEGEILYSHHNDAIGRATGLDAYFFYSAPKFSGWLCYSWLNAQEKLFNDPQGYVPRNTDQRHTLSAIATFETGKNWELSLRGVYGSGYPYTPNFAVYNASNQQWAWQAGRTNSASLPEYIRVDARLSKNFLLFGLEASAYLDVSNIFNIANVFSYSYEFNNEGQPVITEIDLWPILPTLGLSCSI